MHGGQQYSYQILSAVSYTLSNEILKMEIEGDNYEDSIFYDDDGIIAIGEAKLIESEKYWTPRSLFYSSTTKGPVLQLWNRCSGNETPILFSSIPLNQEMSTRNIGIDIQDTKLANIVRDLLEKIRRGNITGVRESEGLNIQSMKTFLARVKFYLITSTYIEQNIMHFAKTDLSGVNNLLGYFNSPGYSTKKRISRNEILLLMKYPIDSFKKPTVSEGTLTRILTDRKEMVELQEIPEQQIEKIRGIFRHYSRKSLKSWAISSNQKQRNYLQERFQEHILTLYLDACRVFPEDETLKLPRDFLDAISLRAYGILFTAALSESIRGTGKLRFILEFDPDKTFFNWERTDPRWDVYAYDFFLEWAIKYKGLVERPYDRELMIARDEKSFEEFRQLMFEKYPNPLEVSARLLELLILHEEYDEMLKQAVKEAKKHWGNILLRFIVDSYHELRKASK
jgi:hypothetical protein